MAKPPQTLTIRLHGAGLLPEKVPVSAMAEVVQHIQTLASGDDATKTHLHLTGIRRASAGYLCLADRPDFALRNLGESGKATDEPDFLQFHMINAFEELSAIAGRLNCTIDVLAGAGARILTVTADTFARIRSTALIEDEAVISGELMRVGGATENRCAVRIEGRRKLLYCKVATAELGKLLGRNLYEQVKLSGSGIYFVRTWELLHFSVTHVSVKKQGSFDAFIQELRDAGGDAWDAIEDVDAEIRGMR